MNLKDVGKVLIPAGFAACTLLAMADLAQAADAPGTYKEHCASCHGEARLGGLGPALLPATLQEKPIEGLVATIYYGRPGTPMPPWKQFMSEADAAWIVQKLMSGFPQ